MEKLVQSYFTGSYYYNANPHGRSRFFLVSKRLHSLDLARLLGETARGNPEMPETARGNPEAANPSATLRQVSTSSYPARVNQVRLNLLYGAPWRAIIYSSNTKDVYYLCYMNVGPRSRTRAGYFEHRAANAA
jgi:hypothetical protein